MVAPIKKRPSPTGTGVSARLAVLRARQVVEVGDQLRMRSVIGSEFVGRVVRDAELADGTPAIVPSISGRAWITGTHEHTLDPRDPWPRGYRVADTWPTGP